MATIENLPDEILEIIFNLLPFYGDLKRCKQVCQRWKNLIDNAHFSKNMILQKAIDESNFSWQHFALCENIKPSRRSYYAETIYKDKLYVFGGCSTDYLYLNDLWFFDSTTKSWEKCLTNGGVEPTPRMYATMVAYEDRLIIFGGFKPPREFLNDLHVYDLKTGFWTSPEISSPWPPHMYSPSASVHGQQMVVFGGFLDIFFTLSDDIWTLDLKSFTWRIPETTMVKPIQRSSDYKLRLDDNNLLLIGGVVENQFRMSDIWVLQMTTPVWTWIKIKLYEDIEFMRWCPTCIVGEKLIIASLRKAIIFHLSDFVENIHSNVEGIKYQEISFSEEGLLQNLEPNNFFTIVVGNGELIFIEKEFAKDYLCLTPGREVSSAVAALEEI